jgi:hypothetical protein
MMESKEQNGAENFVCPIMVNVHADELSCPPMLKQYTKIYDRYRILSFKVKYYPSVPTTVGGNVIFGIDTEYDPEDVEYSAGEVVLLEQNKTVRIFESFELNVNARIFQNRNGLSLVQR